jgi:hypothetical protein
MPLKRPRTVKSFFPIPRCARLNYAPVIDNCKMVASSQGSQLLFLLIVEKQEWQTMIFVWLMKNGQQS